MIAPTPMRVVMVNRYATAEFGAEKHALALARQLRARGHAVRFLSTLTEGNAESEGAFVPLTGTDFWRGQPPARQRAAVAANALWNRRASAAMSALLARFRPNVVHLHDIYPQLSVAPPLVAARAGVPVVQTLHNYDFISADPLSHDGGWRQGGDEPLSVRGLRTALYFARRALHAPRVALWIAVSRYVAGAYARHGIEAEVMPHFIEPDERPERAQFEQREGVLYVGRLTEAKGIRDLITLARRLPEIRVTILGRGALEEHVRDASHQLANLEYPGFVSGKVVAARLASARLAVVPSRWMEPAGLVALEAMAEGTPVVAYASGGLAEYVEDARAGRVVSAAAEALSRATWELYHDRAAWNALSANGREAVATTHSPERYVRRLEALYRAVSART